MSDPEEDTVVTSADSEFAETFFAPAEPRLELSFGAASHRGRVRANNEDHYAILRRRRSIEVLHSSVPDLAGSAAAAYGLVVADGMGGMQAGEEASRLALQTMLDLSSQATSWVMRLTDVDAQQIEARVAAYVDRVHAALLQAGRADPAKAEMGTTWTSAHIFGRRVVVVHLGDSRAYHFHDGELQQLTRDETVAQGLIDAGTDPRRAARFRHLLVNNLGGRKDRVYATIAQLELAPGDRLLLCTDGLTEMVPDADIAAELTLAATPQAACDALIQRALDNGGRDNVTVLVAAAG